MVLLTVVRMKIYQKQIEFSKTLPSGKPGTEEEIIGFWIDSVKKVV